MVEERVGLFIDGGYLDHITKYGFSGKINVTIQPPYLKYKRLIWLAEIAKETANLRKSTQIAALSTRA